MRDILLILIVFGTIPYILKKPYIGILVWSWLGYMNPHRLTWGIAYSLPFSQLISIVTLFSVLFSKEKKSFPVTPITIVLILFIIYMSVATMFAIYPEHAIRELMRIYKIQLVVFLTMMLIDTREKIEQLVWVIAVSIGFFGIKGGLFSLVTGGGFRVWGPPGSFIEGNNELGLALLMIIPLFFYLKDLLKKKWQKNLVYLTIFLIFISVLSTYSRGAFLALAMMSFFLWLKLPNKIPVAIAILIFGSISLSFMPDKFYDRMNTIETYEEDSSAMGRINAWSLAINIASDRVFAGGFNHWSAATFQEYAPVPDDVHDAHSIYFEVLGELGFLGLFLFLLLYILTWFKLNKIISKTKKSIDLKWCNSLARLIQVSLVGYATGGAFLGLAYWDLPYHFIALTVILDRYIKENPEKIKKEKIANKELLPAEKKKWAWE